MLREAKKPALGHTANKEQSFQTQVVSLSCVMKLNSHRPQGRMMLVARVL